MVQVQEKELEMKLKLQVNLMCQAQSFTSYFQRYKDLNLLSLEALSV